MTTATGTIERETAITRVRAAAAAVARVGVSALVTGSLARGEFGPGSDVDLLVTACPRHLKYAIEGIVEDCLEGLPFDVIYLDEVPATKRSGFVGEAKRARDLA